MKYEIRYHDDCTNRDEAETVEANSPTEAMVKFEVSHFNRPSTKWRHHIVSVSVVDDPESMAS